MSSLRYSVVDDEPDERFFNPSITSSIFSIYHPTNYYLLSSFVNVPNTSTISRFFSSDHPSSSFLLIASSISTTSFFYYPDHYYPSLFANSTKT